MQIAKSCKCVNRHVKQNCKIDNLLYVKILRGRMSHQAPRQERKNVLTTAAEQSAYSVGCSRTNQNRSISMIVNGTKCQIFPS